MSSIHEAARLKMEAQMQGEVEEPASEEAPDGTDTPENAPPDESGHDGTVEEPEEADSSTDEEGAEAAADEAEAALEEDATEEEIEEARDKAKEDFFVGTYRTKEDAEKGIAENSRVTEELFASVNTLRQQLANQEEARAQAEQQPQELDLPAWEQWAQDQVEAGAGEQGAMAALENGGYAGYETYLRSWMASEDPRDRAQATIFNNGMIMELAAARAQAAAAAVQGQPTEKEMTQQAHDKVQARYPDLDDHTEAMAKVVGELSSEDARWLRELAAEGVEGRAKALRMVYLESTRVQGSGKQETQKTERARRKVSEDRASLDATTSSSEGTAGTRTAPPASEAYALQRKKEFRERQSLPPLEE